jgi:GntR family transcriptional regulator, transcriptional repressor for pyruvate dehydrogenase complex
MVNQTLFSNKQRWLLDYLIDKAKNPQQKIPSIQKISTELGLSTACLREQIELAKNLGLISAQPRKGIEILSYQFKPAVEKSLYYATQLDHSYYYQFSELRNHLENAYFIESAGSLNDESINELKSLINQAQTKLKGKPIQIPHHEHRKFHLSIYARRNNVFLTGLLEAFWDMYEMAGLNLYNDLEYLKNVWDYHGKIVENIKLRNFDQAYTLLISHMGLIDERT